MIATNGVVLIGALRDPSKAIRGIRLCELEL
jgi:hypothetical protein